MKLLFLILLLIIIFLNSIDIKEAFITSIKVSNSDKYLLNTPKNSFDVKVLKNTLNKIDNLDTSTNVLNYNEDFEKYYNYDLKNNILFNLENNITIDNKLCCMSPNCKYLINNSNSWKINNYLEDDDNFNGWKYCCKKCKITKGKYHGPRCQHIIARKCKI